MAPSNIAVRMSAKGVPVNRASSAGRKYGERQYRCSRDGGMRPWSTTNPSNPRHTARKGSIRTTNNAKPSSVMS